MDELENFELIYAGGIRSIPGVPARPLTQEDLDNLAARGISPEQLINSGLYTKPEQVKKTQSPKSTGTKRKKTAVKKKADAPPSEGVAQVNETGPEVSNNE